MFDGDLLRCTPVATADGEVAVHALTDEPEQPRAVFTAVGRAAPAAAMRAGDSLASHRVALDGEWGAEYGTRAGDEFALYTEHGIVHPAVWPALANQLVHTQLARGSWIHTRSIVRHHALAPAGATADVHAVVVRKFHAHGERAVLDVHVEVDGALVASLEHEAIIALDGH